MNVRSRQACHHSENVAGGLHRWPSVDAFIDGAASAGDGLHSVDIGRSVHLDVLLARRPLDPAHGQMSVFFNGAVTTRAGKVPPFLSGVGMSRRVDVPLVAIADPSLSLSQDLGLAWYAGSEGVGVQKAVVRILTGFRRVSGNKMLLVGGSGGGFAALQASQAVGTGVSALVWNPQTDILEYSPPLVKSYLETAFPALRGQLDEEDWKDRSRAVLSSEGIQWEVLSPVAGGLRMDRLLWLQNWDDWHTKRHAVPWMQTCGGFHESWPGVYSTDGNHVLWLTETGEGHAPPAPDALAVLLEQMLSTSSDVLSVVRWQAERELFPRNHQSSYVRDLTPFVDQLRLQMHFERAAAGRITPRSATLSAAYAGIRFRYTLLHGGAAVETKYARLDSTYVAEQAGRPWDELRVTVLDGMDHELYEVRFTRPDLLAGGV